MKPRFETGADSRTIFTSCLRALLVIVLAMSLLFLYLMQRVKSRELDREIALLKSEQAEAVKNLNQLDVQIERLKSPERIVPLARELLGMYTKK